MSEERTTPLRERMIEDMRIHGMGGKAQKAHVRAVKDLALFPGRSPDTATPDDLRAYQLHMADTGVTPTTYNARIMALGFLFGKTCGREEMKTYMQFRTQPRKLPTVLRIEDVSEIVAAAPGPGLEYRAALSISHGAGLRASEVCNLKISDIVPEARLRHDSDRMLIHVERARGARIARSCCHRICWTCFGILGARRGPRVGCFRPSQRSILSLRGNRTFDHCPRTNGGQGLTVQLGQASGGDHQARDPACSAAQLCHPSHGGRNVCRGDRGCARACQAEHKAHHTQGRHQDDPGHAQPVRGSQTAEPADPQAQTGIPEAGVPRSKPEIADVFREHGPPRGGGPMPGMSA